MYAQRYIVGNCVSMNFLFFLLSACLTKQLFSNSLEVFFCPDVTYWDSWVSTLLFVHLFIRKKMSNENVMWTCSRYFLCCLWPDLFIAKDADAKNACTKSAKSTYTKGACIEGSSSKDASTIKHLRIHLQFFGILEVKLFGIAWWSLMLLVPGLLVALLLSRAWKYTCNYLEF